MSTSQHPLFMHQEHLGCNAIVASYCRQCGVLVAGGTKDKYLAIAEAVHKCRLISTPRLTRKDLFHF
jgi:hypothetical protein